ncbi:hypothetical protein Pcac1_g17586 [Phytophthora cactorum]|nr:hypothetical protein Pcac1_g17586 [Phytophthora cactorum]KAG3025584.1 hypothetical protein PC120_g6379 [Phytophthora cactorum]
MRTHMLPPNTTIFLQPIDAGIVGTLQGTYKKKQIEKALSLVEESEDYEGGVNAVDQLVAMQWADEIWSEMKPNAIASCFRRTEIIYPQRCDNTDEDPEDPEDLDVDKLAALLTSSLLD